MAKKSKSGVSFEVKNKKETVKSIKKKFDKFLKKSGILEEIVELILLQVRDGINPATGRSFKALKSVTIDWREGVARYNQTHENFRLLDSNLTLTGAFLNSIVGKVVKKDYSIFIEPEGMHPGYIGKNGKNTRKTPVTNLKIAEGQKAMGRDVLKISKKMEKQIVDLTITRFNEEINR